jgi:hypothetical protein
MMMRKKKSNVAKTVFNVVVGSLATFGALVTGFTILNITLFPNGTGSSEDN